LVRLSFAVLLPIESWALTKKIREKKASYILAVKDNQGLLHNGIKEYFEGQEEGDIRALPEDIWIGEQERGHGRIEKREVRTVTDINWLPGKEKWKDLMAIVQYRCYRTVGGETTKTDRCYISNMDLNADEFYRCLRGHWSIENKLHWSLDVIFGEDAAQVTKNHAPENLNILRKTALSLLRSAPSPRPVKGQQKISGPKRRFTAAMNPNYMFTVLFGK
jgi:predicted transposase YbfD/YdcC